MAKQTKLNRMTAAALFSALTVILQLIATFIKFGPFSITLALAPIIVGAAVYGKGFGALLGTVLGIVNLAAGIFGWDGAAGSCIQMDTKTDTSFVFTMHVRNCGFSYDTIHPTLRDMVFG